MLPSALAALALVALPATAPPPGQWVPPLAGALDVRRAFDPPDEPWGPGHRGVDLAGSPGDVVRAAGAGEITFAGPLAGRGVVTVTHGTLRTTYEPVSATVEVGDLVETGEQIGTLDPGHPGRADLGAALLHWGLRRGDDYLDPLSLLRPPVIRLLPFWTDQPRVGPPAPRWTAPADLAAPLRTETARDTAGSAGRDARGPVAAAGWAGAAVLATGVSRARRRASPAAAARPWYASGRSGSP